MSGININDLILAVCRLGNFMIYVSTPEDALDRWDAREFERTKTSYEYLRSDIDDYFSENHSKAGDHFYNIPLIKRDNHTVKHALQIVPIEQNTRLSMVYKVFNRIFVEENNNVCNYCVIFIPQKVLTMSVGKEDKDIISFDSMCDNLISGLLKVLVNDPDPRGEYYQLRLILYKVFAKKLLGGSDYIKFSDSPYPEECQKLYDAFNAFDPYHQFKLPSDSHIHFMTSVLTNII